MRDQLCDIVRNPDGTQTCTKCGYHMPYLVLWLIARCCPLVVPPDEKCVLITEMVASSSSIPVE